MQRELEKGVREFQSQLRPMEPGYANFVQSPKSSFASRASPA